MKTKYGAYVKVNTVCDGFWVMITRKEFEKLLKHYMELGEVKECDKDMFLNRTNIFYKFNDLIFAVKEIRND